MLLWLAHGERARASLSRCNKWAVRECLCRAGGGKQQGRGTLRFTEVAAEAAAAAAWASGMMMWGCDDDREMDCPHVNGGGEGKEEEEEEVEEGKKDAGA